MKETTKKVLLSPYCILIYIILYCTWMYVTANILTSCDGEKIINNPPSISTMIYILLFFTVVTGILTYGISLIVFPILHIIISLILWIFTPWPMCYVNGFIYASGAVFIAFFIAIIVSLNIY